MRLTKRRLVMVAAALGVVLVAIAVAIGWWQVALVVIAGLQAAGVVLAVDTRGRVATAREVRRLATAVQKVSRRVDNVSTRVTAVTEAARLDANDRFAEINQGVEAVHQMVGQVAETDQATGARVAGLETALTSIGGDLERVGGQVDGWRGDVDRMNADLVKAYEVSEQRRIDGEKSQTWASARQVRQVEALFQLFAKVTPRAAMPSSGGWALDATSILTLIEVVERRRPRVVVELGSGTSSVWLGYVLQRLGSGKLISVDHEEKYAEATRALIEAHGLGDVVEVRLAPLADSDLPDHEAPWYDASVLDDTTGIDLLIVDGPPQKTGRLSRYPALPKLIGSLSPDAVVAVDDANRPDEKEMVELWRERFPELRDEELPPGGALKLLARQAAAQPADA